MLFSKLDSAMTFALGLILAILSSPRVLAQSADTIYYGGYILTMAGDAPKQPRPSDSTCNISTANAGKSAIAPPNNTASISSDIAPSSNGVLIRNCHPALMLSTDS